MADTAPPKKPKDFFISRRGADRAWAEWIGWHLTENGYTVTLQDWDFQTGQSFVHNMQRATQECERTLLVLTPRYFGSGFTNAEWETAFANDPYGDKGLIVPVLVEPCTPEELGLLTRLAWIELAGLERDQAAAALLDGVKPRGRPASEPSFPIRKTTTPAPSRLPDALPPVWNIDAVRNPHFTGREDLLKSLDATLQSGKTAAVTQAFIGLGGVGKTQLALEYAYRYRDRYEIVWWLRAEQNATLATDTDGLARALGLDLAPNTPPDDIRRAVRQTLAQKRKWLLVFDNAVRSEDVVPYLPQTGGHTLITSRNQHWDEIATPLPVEVWPRADSVAYVLHRTGSGDLSAADRLADALQDLPLALTQAASYVVQARISLSEYLDRFGAAYAHLQRTPVGYDKPVATTWDLAMEAVRAESPQAADLLRLCAFMAPDSIPRNLVSRFQAKKSLVQRLFSRKSEATFDEAVIALRRYSLVETTEETLSVHRLVQRVTRDRLEAAERKSWAEAALQQVNAAFPYKIDDPATWEESGRLLPHALAAAGHAEGLEVTPERAARLFNESALYLQNRADYAGAKAAFERALRIGEQAFGTDHPQVAIYANNLGMVLRAQGDLVGAKAAYERALAIFRRFLGEEHPNTQLVARNLAFVVAEMDERE